MIVDAFLADRLKDDVLSTDAASEFRLDRTVLSLTDTVVLDEVIRRRGKGDWNWLEGYLVLQFLPDLLKNGGEVGGVGLARLVEEGKLDLGRVLLQLMILPKERGC